MLGAIELGGTKIICGVSLDGANFIETTQIETTDPESAVLKISDFLSRSETDHRKLDGLGLASFGPVDIDVDSQTYGTILETPKAGWSNYPLLKSLRSHFSSPALVTTDVNAALLAEHQIGAAHGVQNAVYVTIGTGIGAGVMVNGQLVHGFLHPEVGHMRVPTYGEEGICPFHGNCLEGLASGPAIAARAGRSANSLPDDHPVWDDVAINLADMCNNLLMTLATERIVLGGGVMSQSALMPKIHENLKQKLNNYLPVKKCIGGIDSLVVKAEIEGDSGLAGALIIAAQAARNG